MLFFFGHFASPFWFKENEENSEGDLLIDNVDLLMVVDDDMTESIFNSRGPRSLYRGLEEASETQFWEEEDDFDEFI